MSEFLKGVVKKIYRIQDEPKADLVCLEEQETKQSFYLSIREGQAVEFEVSEEEGGKALNLTWLEDVDFVRKGVLK